MVSDYWKWTGRRWLSALPGLYFPLACRRRVNREKLVREHSGVCIEGFPRCGNTFAVAAFQDAQPTPTHIGRHYHLPAHVLRAVSMGIPTLLLIRHPVDAVASFVTKESDLHVGWALKYYTWFYRTLFSHYRRFVLGHFERVTTDFGSVIDQLNARYGTHFSRFDHTPENVQRIYGIIEKMDQDYHETHDVEETRLGRPSTEKDAGKRAALSVMQNDRGVARRLAEAQSTYQALMDAADHS